jgi:hypothetical protein
MKLDRNRVSLKKTTEQDDGFMEGTPQERVSFVWELTAEVWSLKDPENVKRRLQRNITKLIRVPIINKRG